MRALHHAGADAAGMLIETRRVLPFRHLLQDRARRRRTIPRSGETERRARARVRRPPDARRADAQLADPAQGRRGREGLAAPACLRRDGVDPAGLRVRSADARGRAAQARRTGDPAPRRAPPLARRSLAARERSGRRRGRAAAPAPDVRLPAASVAPSKAQRRASVRLRTVRGCRGAGAREARHHARSALEREVRLAGSRRAASTFR